MVSIQLADYQLKLARGYNRNMRPREFVVGDLVLRRAVGYMKTKVHISLLQLGRTLSSYRSG